MKTDREMTTQCKDVKGTKMKKREKKISRVNMERRKMKESK